MFGLILSSAAAVSVSIYIYNNYIYPSYTTRKITADYTTIGVVKEIIIYPLDGGPGRSVTSAYCTKSGLRSTDKEPLEDRSYIAYSRKNTAILNVLNPELATKDIDILLNVILDRKKQTKHRREKNIQYLGGTMTVLDQGSDVAIHATQILRDIARGVKIGYCSLDNRKHFNDYSVVHPGGKVVGRYSPYFASYTLVNHASIRNLKKQRKAKISPMDFRANVVIDGAEFIEDNIYSLKIGENVFSEVQPCTHTPSAFTCTANIANPEKLQPYKYLKRNRSCSSVRPELGNFEFPAFGITMILSNKKPENVISVGDTVKATKYYYEDS